MRRLVNDNTGVAVNVDVATAALLGPEWADQADALTKHVEPKPKSDPDPNAAPNGNASTKEWAAYAAAQGLGAQAELEALGRDKIRGLVANAADGESDDSGAEQ